METILLSITVLSLAAAAWFAVFAWRARAEEQRRSAARVAALASALAASETSIPGGAPIPVAVGSMFAVNTRAGAGRFVKQLIFTGVATAIVVIGGTALRHDAATEAALPPAIAPLELVSMRHALEGRTLTVTGLVRNPPGGAPLTRVTAVVFAFARNGDFIASGRHALELQALAPGDESPFAVRMTDLGDVGRYRVSFRTEDGLLRHLDGRQKEPRPELSAVNVTRVR